MASLSLFIISRYLSKTESVIYNALNMILSCSGFTKIRPIYFYSLFTPLLGCYWTGLLYLTSVFYLRGLFIYLEEAGIFLLIFLLLGLLTMRLWEEFRFRFLLLFDFCRLLFERDRLREPLASGDLPFNWLLLAAEGDLFLILCLLILEFNLLGCLGSTFLSFCKLWLRLLLLFNLSFLALGLCLVFLIMFNKINNNKFDNEFGRSQEHHKYNKIKRYGLTHQNNEPRDYNIKFKINFNIISDWDS